MAVLSLVTVTVADSDQPGPGPGCTPLVTVAEICAEASMGMRNGSTSSSQESMTTPEALLSCVISTQSLVSAAQPAPATTACVELQVCWKGSPFAGPPRHVQSVAAAPMPRLTANGGPSGVTEPSPMCSRLVWKEPEKPLRASSLRTKQRPSWPHAHAWSWKRKRL